MNGTPEFRECMAQLMQRFFLPEHTIDPNHLCISAGAPGPARGRRDQGSCWGIATLLAGLQACMLQPLLPRAAAACSWGPADMPLTTQARLLPPLPLPCCHTAGCSAILDSLFYCVCDEGDGVLIPAPYYPAFDNDLQVGGAATWCSRGGCRRRQADGAAQRSARNPPCPAAALATARPCPSPCSPVPQARCCVHPCPFFLSEEAAAGPNGLSIEAQLDAAADDVASYGIPVKARCAVLRCAVLFCAALR